MISIVMEAFVNMIIYLCNNLSIHLENVKNIIVCFLQGSNLVIRLGRWGTLSERFGLVVCHVCVRIA